MKKTVYFFLFMFISITAFGQFEFNWEEQLISEGNNLKSMSIVNDTTTILVGYGRTFVNSADQGETWDHIPILDPVYDFGDVSINSSGLGYALAGDVKVVDDPYTATDDVYASGLLLKTTDFGATWTLVDPTIVGAGQDKTEDPNAPDCYTRHFYSVAVHENNSVLLSVQWYAYDAATLSRETYGGTFMSTDGTTWTPVTDDGNVSYSITASPSYFYYGGSKHLFRADATTGVTVSLLDAMTAAADDNVYINDIITKGQDSVFLVTTADGILLSTDQGATFSKLAGTGIPTGANDMIIVNDTVWVLLGTTSKNYTTRDGGETWAANNPGATCYEAAGILNDTILGLGKSNLYKQAVADVIAGNFTWVTQEIVANENLQKIAIIDNHKAVIAAYGQTLVSTSDGGATWESCNLPELFVYGAEFDFEGVSTVGMASYATAHRFKMVDYPSSGPYDRYVNGLLLKSMDYWKTWEILDNSKIGSGADPTVDPNAVNAFMMDPSAITTVNDTIVYMFARWNDSIAGVDTRVGHGNVFLTEDGGASWMPLFEDLGNDVINEIYAVDKDHVFVVGNSFFRKTADGGKTWTNMYREIWNTASPEDSTIFFYGIEYVDASNWYLHSSTNGAYATSDGGVTYKKIKADSGNGMIRLNDSTLIILGSTTKSGISWDYGETWTSCTPGASVYAIGGILNNELVALGKSSIYKIPVADLEAPSNETDILSFTLTEQTGAAVIDAVNHTINIEVAEGTDYTKLIPTLTVSEGATVSPASGTEQDFTNPVGYTVTAEDQKTTQVWTVTVTVFQAPSREANILTFVLAEQTGNAVIDAVNHTVTIEVAAGTNVTSLTPTITISDLATISPASGVAQNFTNPVSYTVTAEDTDVSLVWTVTVTVYIPPSTEADILSFMLPEQTGNAVIDAVNHTVTIEVEEGTDPSALAPMITVSEGATITPASLVTLDFTNPVTYTVTAEDGTTTVVWTVTVTVKTGTVQLTMDNIIMYPNPVKDKLYLENLERVDRIAIISITGNKVLSIVNPSVSAEIDLDAFENGIYFISFKNNEGNEATRKLIINR